MLLIAPSACTYAGGAPPKECPTSMWDFLLRMKTPQGPDESGLPGAVAAAVTWEVLLDGQR